MTRLTRRELTAGMLLAATAPITPAFAAGQAPGVTDKEIKIGGTVPLSGPVSAYGVAGRSLEAYFAMVNDNGGVNGRKINYMAVDDAYSPPKTVEQTRRLVEQDEVAFIFGTLGTPTNIGIRKYLNGKGIPQALILAGATTFADPQQYPWTLSWTPNYFDEAATYARRIMQNQPGQKIGLMYAKDDSGRDYAEGFKTTLGDKANLIAAEVTYETSEPTVDSQLARLKASGATVFFFHATPKFGALIIRGIHEMGWKPVTYVASTASSVAGVLEPAGLERAQGLISTAYLKDAGDPQWDNDEEMKAWRAWMAKYNPKGDASDWLNVNAYAQGACLVKVLQQAGNDLSRENIMAQLANIDFRVPMLLPGVTLKTSKTDYRLIKKLRLIKFEGKRWQTIPE
ncbi:MAG: ABC transporter substrate-binding protein [Hyphomicrobiales bacterium]|nr:ABC transporter substrate-binding protein [Hyphomicrobiales bacterium]